MLYLQPVGSGAGHAIHVAGSTFYNFRKGFWKNLESVGIGSSTLVKNGLFILLFALYLLGKHVSVWLCVCVFIGLNFIASLLRLQLNFDSLRLKADKDIQKAAK